MPAKKKLRTFVHVQNPETGTYEVFGPESDLPEWASKAITPRAFEGGEDPEAAQAASVVPPPPGSPEAEAQAAAEAAAAAAAQASGSAKKSTSRKSSAKKSTASK